MTIQRQYTLPNCTLILEGLEETTEGDNLSDATPMSILVNAELQFVGSETSLSGGGIFFENLVKAVSAYGQEFLSGLPHPQESQENSPRVQIESVKEQNLHRLSLESEESETDQEKVEVDLTTVQLFDLVEAIDQFFADSNTLPDLSFQVQSLSKRYRKPEEPLVDRVTPVAVGVTSLALAAVAFWMIPPPEVKEPKPQLESNPTETLPPSPQSQPPGTVPSAPNSPETGE